MHCYCKERESNPKVAELMEEIPPGFCGECDICDEPGHTRAHPSLPISGAWCDRHWAELEAKKQIGLGRVVAVGVVIVSVVAIGNAIWQLVR